MKTNTFCQLDTDFKKELGYTIGNLMFTQEGFKQKERKYIGLSLMRAGRALFIKE